MRKNKPLIFILLILIGLVIGCSKPETVKDGREKVGAPPKEVTQEKPNTEKETPKKPVKEEPALRLRDYFPVGKGFTWKYKGEGNEYASFTRVVVYTKGNLAQIKDDNGGSVSQAVYKSTDQAITRIFFRGEEYSNTNFLNSKPNEHLVILKTPLKVGTKWPAPNGSREIVATNAKVTTPAGTFIQCIKVKITSKDSVVNEYYTTGVGLVKQEFIAPEGTVTSSLASFSNIIESK